MVIFAELKRKETGTEHVTIATSKFEVYHACQDSIHIFPGYAVLPLNC